MDWKTLFFAPDGRIGRSTFWIGWLVLLGVNVVLGWIPLFGWLLSLVTIYCYVCVSAKRLHDMGKSGWLTLIPVVTAFILPVVGVFLFGGAALFAGLTRMSEEAAAATVLSSLGGLILVVMASWLVALGFLIWQGVSNGDPGENRYGPPPLQPVVA
ncbi:MAG: DUF805 domain-containing protein [Caulobacter sp.]|nr:DUF805 domain-containing protein [Caulobacter sp.]